MKALKVFLWLAVALLVLVLIAGTIFALTFDPNRYKDEVERLVSQRTGRTLKLNGPLEMAFYPSLGVKVSDVSLSEQGGKGPFASLRSAHASVALLPLLGGEVIVDRVRLEGVQANIVKGKDGRFNFADLLEPQVEKAAPGPQKGQARGEAGRQAPVVFDIAGVTIEDSAITYRDIASGEVLQLSDLNLETGRIAEGAQGKIDFSTAVARAKPPLQANVSMNGQYALKPEAIALDFTAKLDQSTIKGNLGIGRSAQPAYTFDLAIDQLNLDRYLASSAKKGEGASSTEKTDGEKPKPAKAEDAPVDLSGLKGLQAKGQLQVGALQVQGLKLANLKTEVRAAGGRAEIGPHSANLYEGTLAGTLTLDGNANRVLVKERLSNVAVGPLLVDLAEQDKLEGRGNVTVDLQASGKTVNAMKAGLAGTAQVQLRDGAIKGVDIGAIVSKARAALGREPAEAAADGKARTDFSELNATFRIKNGVAHNEDLEVKAPLFRLGGAGDIDLAKETVDYLAKASVVATTKGQGGRELEQLAGVTIPVRVVGPFDALKYQVDYRGVAADVAKSRVGGEVKERIEQQREKIENRIEDKVRDRLKGLLGR